VPTAVVTRELSARDTDDQAQEPKRIDSNCVVWLYEWGRGGREGARFIWVNRSLIDICEIEIGGVLWVLLEVLN
jgi:hypothetical protein